MADLLNSTSTAVLDRIEEFPARRPVVHAQVLTAVQTPGQLSMTSGYLPTLDGWRAVAVIMVIACHAIHPVGNWLSLLGPYGVSIFFGISGFLICSRLLDEEERRGRIDLGRFYVRRAFRILPAAWAYLAAVGLLASIGKLTVDPRQLAGCVLVCRNYFPFQITAGDWFTRHFWSLAVEEHFYLLFPLLLWACGAKRACFLVPLLAVGVAGWRAIDYRTRLLTDLMPHVYPQLRSDMCMDGLLCGCSTALLVRYIRIIPGGQVIAMIGLGSLALAVAGMTGVVPMPDLLLAVLIPWALAGTALQPASIVGRILEAAPLRWIGRSSNDRPI